MASMADIARWSLLRLKGVFQVSGQLLPVLSPPVGRVVARGGVGCDVGVECWADEHGVVAGIARRLLLRPKGVFR